MMRFDEPEETHGRPLSAHNPTSDPPEESSMCSIPSSIHTMEHLTQEEVLERIRVLEQRVAALESELQEKDALLQTLSGAADQPEESRKEQPVQPTAEKRPQEALRDGEKAAEEEQPAKKETFFPKIGDIVEQAAQAKEDGEVGANGEQEGDDDDDDDDLGETGVRTTAMGVTEVRSLCLQCEEDGVTKLLLTEIPFFRQIILMSFVCSHCGFKDVQIKPGAPVQDKGHKITFKVQSVNDLSRQIIKSDSCTLRIEELDFEIPPSRGIITNLEGIITDAVEGLESTQGRRRLLDGEEACEKVEIFIKRLQAVLAGELLPLTAVFDDPAGNSFVENPFAPRSDPQVRIVNYIRTWEQAEALGLQVDDPAKSYKSGSALQKRANKTVAEQIQDHFANHEVLQIPNPCPNCMTEGTADSCIVNLPFFKEVIIMAFTCDECGFKDTEIKGGGPIPKMGRVETLRVTEPKVDLARDVIKSDTAGVKVPELDLELTRGSLGGVYTTVEGLMQKMKDNLFENPLGDSADPVSRARLNKLEQDMQLCIDGYMPFTLIVQDPLANSYIHSPYDPPSSDPRLTVVNYERSWEEDDELGLHDMVVDEVDFVEPEDPKEAEKVFASLQPDAPMTHPGPYSKGTED